LTYYRILNLRDFHEMSDCKSRICPLLIASLLTAAYTYNLAKIRKVLKYNNATENTKMLT
jgi:hypothetical protein